MNKEQEQIKKVDQYINFFKNIDSRKWTTGIVNDGNGRFCAIGHCFDKVMVADGSVISNTKAKGEKIIFRPSWQKLDYLFLNKIGMGVPSVNDHSSLRFQQRGPKNRILAALNLIKNKLRLKKKSSVPNISKLIKKEVETDHKEEQKVTA